MCESRGVTEMALSKAGGFIVAVRLLLASTLYILVSGWNDIYIFEELTEGVLIYCLLVLRNACTSVVGNGPRFNLTKRTKKSNPACAR